MQEDLVLGGSRVFSNLIKTADEYAQSDWPILILGETGVGKELIARRVHNHSKRARASFLPVNCGAVPGGLFESEFFGFERGAFSGAVQSSKGMVRSAHGGTVFLDEIGEMELALQVKFLRLMDSGEVRSLGTARVDRVDVRFVAATNRNLYLSVRDGDFRLDFLERLSVLTLIVPPLRERLEELEPLARHFLNSWGASFEPGIFAGLASYHWPGNVRELRNLLARASVLGKPRIDVALIERLIREEHALTRSLSAPAADRSLAEIEKDAILERLGRCRGNRKQAAEDLGIAKSTLQEKLRRWRLQGLHENWEWSANTRSR